MLTAASKKSLLLMTAILLSSVLHAASLPDFEASYQLKRGNLIIGTSNISLVNKAGNEYLYESRSWPTKWVSWFLKDKLHETSSGRLDETGLHPVRYHYRRTGGSREREAILSFDWDNLTVENHVEDSRWKMDIPAGTLDKLASQLGMMLALGEGKTEVTFNIADGGKLKEYRFRVIGHETLELPAGTFKTVKITKLRDNKRRETYIWCAPELNYLPVRIWQREKEEAVYQSDLVSFTYASGAATKD
ncbi:MAG: DUF3108 domain-containing protein [Gammaproteobacteria bacterium]|nr:DUF3108 domain-containing protein [Gammaproteobacteria bacterium]